jgi:hypothetical protein
MDVNVSISSPNGRIVVDDQNDGMAARRGSW